ncbi:MAG: cyclophilin-like domain-containing protein [Piptocephalis tieghemiana]|nr:MAG: cyclophilin-like domain-containing protein [Piptocephalis tieghemiana]
MELYADGVLKITEKIRFMCQSGDFTAGNGTGGKSIYGAKLTDENFDLKHTGPGTYSMANTGLNANGFHLSIYTSQTSWLDSKHIIFSKVTEDYEIIKEAEGYGSQSGRTSATVTIADCGQL